MTIKKMQDKAFANALKHGFHHKDQNIGELLMLIVSELGEALEADRGRKHMKEQWSYFLSKYANNDTDETGNTTFANEVKDTFEDELADVVIRVADLCGYLNINLESHIEAKMRYNESRPHKHGKKY